MIPVQAWQHIYSNVEKEQSPKRRGGFQTLFYTTSGLTEAEVSEMESRLLYFPSDVEPVKHLFFTISTGKGVVAQIVALPEPDQFGRKGRYLAHSLVFTPEGLAQFEADPFRVFRRFSFITTVAEALAQGDFRTGDIPAVWLELLPAPARDVQAARRWSVPELKKLALLALRADQQAREREAITFAGGPQQIEDALEASFLVVPTSFRLRCSFDTYFYHCNLVATYYWAIGLPEPPDGMKFALVDGKSRQVQGAVPSHPETAYEHWVLAAIEARRLDEIAHRRNNAFAVAEWLDGREYDPSPLEEASPEPIASVFKANPQPVQALLRSRVGEQLPSALVERVAEHIYRQTEGVVLFRQLRQGFGLAQLQDGLYASYAARNFEEPSQEEVKALGSILGKVDHQLLRLFWASWHDPHKQLPKELERVGEAEYRQFAEIALRLESLDPFSLLIPGHGDAFLDLYLASGVDDLVDLVKALIKVEETACLSRLADYVPKLSRKDLKQLARLIARQADTPEPFRSAVEAASAASPPSKGVRRMLQTFRRRVPGRDQK
jgi:hypothetical protein